MIPLHENNLAKDLLRPHRSIADGGTIAPQDKGAPTAGFFLYIYYAMGYETVLEEIKDNVSPFQLCRCYRLNRDHVAMANGWMHASSRGPKPHSAATA
jgi:hypothetical protein